MAKNNTTSKIESKDRNGDEKVSSLKSKKTSKEISDNLTNPEKEFIKRCDEKIEQIDKKIKKINAE